MKPHSVFVQLICALMLMTWAETRAFAQTVFTHRAGESVVDARPLYEVLLLKLALEKTRDKYGPYELRESPRINTLRIIHSIKSDSFPNYFAGLGYDESYSTKDNMIYVPFPIDLGALSYRTCFIPADTRQKVSEINTLDELRKLTIGQGRGWQDVRVLRHNGFQVEELELYDQLFKMTAVHRFDLFCRGVNEVKFEYDRWNGLEGLGYDRSFLIYYPMPIFFYTHANNKLAAERVAEGLKRAYADGSLLALWRSRHQASVDFVDINKRKFFRLENPWVKSVDFDFTKYFFVNLDKQGRPTVITNAPK